MILGKLIQDSINIIIKITTLNNQIQMNKVLKYYNINNYFSFSKIINKERLSKSTNIT